MKKTLLGLLGCCLSIVSFGQSLDITGKVMDNTESLPNATIVLVSASDSSMVSFALSNSNGFFRLENLSNGDFQIQISYLGYQQLKQDVKLFNEAIDLGNLTLKPESNELTEVEITSEKIPMQVVKDTLVYNADAFQAQPNEVVEDLLKRLPGVEVESDGSIKAQGEDVEQVLVDGKRFFGNDPKIATRNLPADAVDKVEIFDKMSDASEFSGVDDGERQKTINLELKEDRKKGYFGSITGGYGTDSRYNNKFSVNRFTSQTQSSIIGNFNNVNEQGFSAGDYINFMGGMWGGRNSNVPIFNGRSNGFVTTHAGGININHDFNEKTELSFNYFLNNITNTVNSTSTKENFLRDDDSFISTSNADQVSDTDNHRFNLEFEHEIDSSQNIKLVAGLNINQGTLDLLSDAKNFNTSDVLENQTIADYINEGDQQQVSLTTTYRKKFGSKKKRIFTFDGAYNNAHNEAIAELISENNFFTDGLDLRSQDFIVQDQEDLDDQNNFRLSLSFVEPLGKGRYLEFKYRRQNYNNDVESEFYDIVQNERVFNPLISNSFVRDFYYNRYSTAYHINTDKSQLTLEAALQQSNLQGDLILQDIQITNGNTRFLPRLSWRYELGNTKNIRVRYNTSVREPSLEQLQPVADNSNPLDIYIGNPNLVPEYNHRLRFTFFNYDQFSFSNFYTFINFNYTKNKILTTTVIDENFVKTRTPINVAYDLSSNISFEYSKPIRPLKMRMSIRNRFGYSRGLTFVNQVENETSRVNGNIRLRLENRKKDKIDWTLGGSFGYNTISYSNNSNNNFSYNNQSLFTTINYNITNHLTIGSDLDVNFFSEEQFGEAQTVPILKARISAFILKEKRGELKLSAFDLLNRNLGISRVQNDNYIENAEILSLGRYYMLSFTYALKSAGSGGGQRGSRGGRGPR